MHVSDSLRTANKIEEEGFLSNLKDGSGTFISGTGFRTGVETFERGYMLGLQAGKIINLSASKGDAALKIRQRLKIFFIVFRCTSRKDSILAHR